MRLYYHTRPQSEDNKLFPGKKYGVHYCDRRTIARGVQSTVTKILDLGKVEAPTENRRYGRPSCLIRSPFSRHRLAPHLTWDCQRRLVTRYISFRDARMRQNSPFEAFLSAEKARYDQICSRRSSCGYFSSLQSYGLHCGSLDVTSRLHLKPTSSA
jgi:hypothetical protein